MAVDNSGICHSKSSILHLYCAFHSDRSIAIARTLLIRPPEINELFHQFTEGLMRRGANCLCEVPGKSKERGRKEDPALGGPQHEGVHIAPSSGADVLGSSWRRRTARTAAIRPVPV